MAISSPKTWVSIARAAEILDEPAEGLRKKLTRAHRSLAADGVPEVQLGPGIRARKCGRNWKIQLSEGWTEGAS